MRSRERGGREGVKRNGGVRFLPVGDSSLNADQMRRQFILNRDMFSAALRDCTTHNAHSALNFLNYTAPYLTTVHHTTPHHTTPHTLG
jgi:hypothetical protein